MWDSILDAIRDFDPLAPWQAHAPRLRPMLPRRRSLPVEAEPPERRTFDPGIVVSFGVDIGPAFLYVAGVHLDEWHVSLDQVAAQALQNVRDLVDARRHHALIRDTVHGSPVTAFQSGDGWASSLLLVPDLLGRVLGEAPALILAPSRDVVIRMPVEADPAFARRLLDELAGEDPNGLDVPILSFVDGTLRFAATGVRGQTGRRH